MGLLVIILFFISGACGLIYQVTWTRIMTHIFGTTVFAISIVLTAFMTGLALGSYFLGKRADRSKRPLALYAYFELGIGASALLSLYLMDGLHPLYLRLHGALGGFPAIFNTARFALAFLILLLPTILMGATLPILCRFLIRQMRQLGKNLGTLYSINTFGAVIGSLLTGFLLLKWLGVHPTVHLACALNAAVGVVAWFASLFVRSPPPEDPAAVTTMNPGEQADGAPQEAWRLRLLLFAFFVSGFTSFAYEIFWTRSLVFLLGNSTYAFVTMLTAFLSGIALGGYLARFFVDRLTDPMRVFAWIEILIGLSAAVAMPLLTFVVYSDAVQGLFRTGSASWLSLFLCRFGISLLVMLIPTLLIGATLPLVGRIYVKSLHQTGKDVGKIYAVNTMGNILGAFVPGFFLLPLLGINKGVLCMALLNLVVGAAILISEFRRVSVIRTIAALAAVCLVGFIAWLPVDFQFPSDTQRKGDRVLFYKEGISGTTKVYLDPESGTKSISVDGVNIGGTNFYVNHKQQVLAHLPKLLISGCKHELSVGLGSGILIGECAKYDELEKIICVELIPSVVEGAGFFKRETDDVLNRPGVEIIVNDGVNLLMTTSETYDIISSDAKSKPEHGGNGVFFSTEYYELIREHLTPGGLVIQWIPIYYPHDSYLMIFKTFLGVFPHASLWLFPAGHSFLVGSTRELEVDFARIRRMLDEKDGPLAGLRQYGITSAEALLAHCVTGESLLKAKSARAEVNSMEHPRIEFYSFHDYAVPFVQRNLINMEFIRSLRKDVYIGPRLINITSKERERLDRHCRALNRYLGGLYTINSGKQGYQKHFNEALDISGGAEIIRFYIFSHEIQKVQFLFNKGKYKQAEAAVRGALDLFDRSGRAHYFYGALLARKGSIEEAAAELEKAVSLSPDHIRARRELASVYMGQERYEEAAGQLLFIVDAIDGENVEALKVLVQCLSEKLSDPDRAEPYLKRLGALEKK